MEYLRKYLEPEPKIFTIQRKQVVTFEFRFRGKHSKFLLQYLERLLQSKNFKPTGFHPFNCPDIDWMKTIILSLEPEDKLGLLGISYPGWGVDQRVEAEKELVQINPL